MSSTVHCRAQLILGLLLVSLAATLVLSLGIGRYPVSPATVLRIVWSLVSGDAHPPTGSWTDTELIVVASVRLPRVLVAAMAGAGLGLSGAVLQGVFRNPLVGPQVVGISHGAAWGGIVGILVGASAAGIVGWAFAFAFAALVGVFLLSRVSGSASILTIVLAGVIVSAFFSALVGLAEFVADTERQLPGIVYWLLGSFANVSSRSVAIVGVPTLLAGAALLLVRWRINILSLGDSDATALGLSVSRWRWIVLVLVTLIVAAQVAVSGAIGWVGLVVPHLARRLVGPNHQHLLPASAVLGAVYLLAVDTVARSLAAQELPIGVLTALLGTPVFALVFWKSQAKGWTRE